MAAYNVHFPIRVLVQQNGSHVLRVLIDVTDIHVNLEVRETIASLEGDWLIHRGAQLS